MKRITPLLVVACLFVVRWDGAPALGAGRAAAADAKDAAAAARPNDNSTPKNPGEGVAKAFGKVAQKFIDGQPGGAAALSAQYRITPLHQAAVENKTAEAKKLIAAHADVNARDFQGSTPLHYAAAGLGADIIPVLLAAGADINAKDKDGETPLHRAMRFGGGEGTKAIPYLLKANADLNAVDNEGRTPLFCACSASSFPDLDKIKQLIAAGADVNRAPKDGFGPLHWACAQNPELAEILIAAGATVNARDKREGATPLIWAARHGHTEVIAALLKAKADPNLRDNKGWSPLAYAAEYGHTDAADALRQAGAGEPTWTKLHIAAAFGKPEALAAILKGEEKSNLNAKDVYGRTPLFWALRSNDDEAANVLAAAGADLKVVDKRQRSVLLTAAWAANLPIMKKAVAAGADVNAVDDEGYTPLLWAASSSDVEPLHFLLEKGAKVNVATKSGDTPVLLAIPKGKPETIKLLLAAGADLLAVNSDGESVESESWRIFDDETRKLLKKAIAEAKQKRIERICRLYAADNPHALKAEDVKPTTPNLAAMRMYRALFGPSQSTFTTMFTSRGTSELATIYALYDAAQEHIAFRRELTKVFGADACQRFDDLKIGSLQWTVYLPLVDEERFQQMEVEVQGESAVVHRFPGFERSGDVHLTKKNGDWRIDAAFLAPAGSPVANMRTYEGIARAMRKGRELLGRKPTRMEDVKRAMLKASDAGAGSPADRDCDEEIAVYTEAIRRDPKDAQAYKGRGDACFIKRELDKAVADYSRAIQLDPKYASAYIERSNMFGIKGDWERAMDDGAEAVRLDPKSPVAINALGVAFDDCASAMLRADEKAGNGIFDRAAKYFDGPPGTLDDVQQQLPFNGSVNEFKAAARKLDRAHKVQLLLDYSAADFKTAIDLRPYYDFANNNLGVYYAKRKGPGDMERAEKYFRVVTGAYPRYADAWNNLGSVLVHQGKFDEAIACYKTVLTLRDYSASDHTNLGGAYFEKGDLVSALSENSNALRCDPNYAPAWANRVEIYLKRKDLDEAVKCVRRLVAANPESPIAHRAVAQYTTKCIELNRPDDAIALLDESLKANPSVLDLYYMRAHAWQRKGDRNRARQDLEQVLRLHPGIPQVQAELDALGAKPESPLPRGPQGKLDAIQLPAPPGGG